MSDNSRHSYAGRQQRIQRIKSAVGCSETNATVLYDALAKPSAAGGIEHIEREFEAAPEITAAEVRSPRHCMDCGTTIEECDGSVLARDVKALIEEGLPPRERCGKCAIKVSERRGEQQAEPLEARKEGE